MNETNKKSGKLRYIYSVVILLSLLMFFISIMTSCSRSDVPYSRLEDSGISSFSDNWHVADSSGNINTVSEISKWKEASQKTFTFSKTLPELTDYDCLFIEVNYTYIKVFINGSCIFDHSASEIKAPSNMTGHFTAQIPLDADMSGQTVSIEVCQPYAFLRTGLNSVMLGTGSAYITHYLSTHIELLISLFFMLIAGICLLAVYLWQRFIRKLDSYRVFRPLAVLLLFSVVWIFTDSQLPQLFWKNPVIICVLSFFSFMVLPIPVFSFVGRLCPDKYGVLTKVQFLLLINILVQGMLFSLNIFSFVEMLKVTHFLIILSVVVLLVFLLKHYRKDRSQYTRPMLSALVILIVSALFSLIHFYVSPQTDNSRYLRYGFLVFIGIMVYICIRIMLSFLHDYTEHQILKDLAYKDFLTGAESRLAFENQMEKMRSLSTPVPVTVYTFDLNNLKTTNDTFGHMAGDIILKATVLCITDVFQDLGRIFRIGGDEFVVIIQSPNDDPAGLLEKLQDRIRLENETCEFPFSVSAGQASSKAVCGNALDQLLKKADQEMYRDKEIYREHLSRHREDNKIPASR